MPNHVLTIGLFARDYERLEALGKEEHDFSGLAEKNLCEVVRPMPGALQGIVATSPKTWWRHKETGAMWVEDCNGPPPDKIGEYHEEKMSKDSERDLISLHGAASWYEWCPENWGTKWGTYEQKVHELGGDGRPVLIEFQSAWSQPSPKVMQLITKHIEETYALRNGKWLTHNPDDGEIDSTDIEDSE